MFILFKLFLPILYVELGLFVLLIVVLLFIIMLGDKLVPKLVSSSENIPRPPLLIFISLSSLF